MDFNILAMAYAKKIAEKGIRYVLECIRAELDDALTLAANGKMECMINSLHNVHSSVGCILEAYEAELNKPDGQKEAPEDDL